MCSVQTVDPNFCRKSFNVPFALFFFIRKFLASFGRISCTFSQVFIKILSSELTSVIFHVPVIFCSSLSWLEMRRVYEVIEPLSNRYSIHSWRYENNKNWRRKARDGENKVHVFMDHEVVEDWNYWYATNTWLAYSGLTACRRQLYNRCSALSSSLSSLTPLRRGAALRPPSTDSVSILFCVELHDLTCGH